MSTPPDSRIDEWRAATMAATERPMITRLDAFAAHLAEHNARADPPQIGGDAKRAARRLGLADASSNGMLQRLRRDLGWQAE